MRIKIDVDEFYLEEDGGLEEELKKYIISEAVSSINEKIKEKIETEIKQVAEKYVLEGLSSEMTKAIKEGKIKRKSDNIPVLINEYIADCLLNSGTSWQSFDKIIREVSKNFCDEMRKRYDLAFASNIVANLIDNKMIKEDVVKGLLTKNT